MDAFPQCRHHTADQGLLGCRLGRCQCRLHHPLHVQGESRWMDSAIASRSPSASIDQISPAASAASAHAPARASASGPLPHPPDHA